MPHLQKVDSKISGLYLRSTQGHPTVSSSYSSTGSGRRRALPLAYNKRFVTAGPDPIVQTGAVGTTNSSSSPGRRRHPGSHRHLPPPPEYPSAPTITYITFPTSDGNSSKWPEPFTIHVPESDDDDEDVGIPFRIDDEGANAYRALVSAEDDERRAKKIKNWKVKIGTYLGGRRDAMDEDVADPASMFIYTQVGILIMACGS
jgi:hypothetical protein